MSWTHIAGSLWGKLDASGNLTLSNVDPAMAAPEDMLFLQRGDLPALAESIQQLPRPVGRRGGRRGTMRGLGVLIVRHPSTEKTVRSEFFPLQRDNDTPEGSLGFFVSPEDITRLAEAIPTAVAVRILVGNFELADR